MSSQSDEEWDVREETEWKVPDFLRRMGPVLSSISILLGVFVPFYTMQNDRFTTIERNQEIMRKEILTAVKEGNATTEKRMDYILKKSLSNDIQVLEAKNYKDRTDVENHLIASFEREMTSL